MPTRFYLPSSGAAEISPAIDGSWNSNTGSPPRRGLARAPTGTAMASIGPISEGSAAQQYNVFFAQFVSAPLAAQTIEGSVSGWVRAAENNIAANANGQLVIRVVSGDGSTVRGTLLAATAETSTGNPANEFTTTLSSRLFPGSGGTLSSLAVQDGDRLVVEVGSRNHNNATTNYTTTLNFGDDSPTDLSAAAQTAANNPWIEFSQDIVFQGEASGPTRFYLPSTGVPDITPSPSGSWGETGGFDRRNAVRTRINSSMTSKTTANSSLSTANLDHLSRQYISEGLPAQTIRGLVKGQIRALEANDAADARAQIIVRVVSSDGSTVRGTLYAGDTGALSSEFVTSLTNRSFPRGGARELSALTISEGDRLVIEVGYRRHVASNNVNLTGTLNYGDNHSTTDLPENETATAANNPWIEFSQSLFPPDVIELTGTITGTSATSGSLSSKKALSGSLSGAGSVSGVIRSAKALSGALSGAGEVDGALSAVKSLSGSIAGDSAVSGAIGYILGLSGEIVGSSAVFADAPLSMMSLSGSLHGEGVTIGDISSLAQVAGSVAGDSSVSGSLGVLYPLSGEIAGSSEAAGNLSLSALLDGVVAGESSASAALSIIVPLSGDVAGTAIVAGDVSMLASLDGSVFGASDVFGNLTEIVIVHVPRLGGAVWIVPEPALRAIQSAPESPILTMYIVPDAPIGDILAVPGEPTVLTSRSVPNPPILAARETPDPPIAIGRDVPDPPIAILTIPGDET